jgi:hypothetical protein
MKFINIVAVSFGFALSCSYSNPLLAAETIPQEIIDFAEQNGLVLGKVAPQIKNKYSLAGKTIKLAGKLSISGKVSYLGHNVPFSAPGVNSGIWQTSYIFGQKRANGTIPFKLDHPEGTFDGIMTPIKPDTYILKMNNPHGSLLSSLAYAGQKSGTGTWKNTKYSYTAVVTQKIVKGVASRYFKVTELASFKFNLLALYGATANYAYSLDWQAKIK